MSDMALVQHKRQNPDTTSAHEDYKTHLNPMQKTSESNYAVLKYTKK